MTVAADGLTIARARASPDPAAAINPTPFPPAVVPASLATVVVHWQLANGLGFSRSSSYEKKNQNVSRPEINTPP